MGKEMSILHQLTEEGKITQHDAGEMLRVSHSILLDRSEHQSWRLSQASGGCNRTRREKWRDLFGRIGMLNRVE